MKQSSWLRRLVEDDTVHPYIILDSGAYSVWRSGAKVDATKFLAYCATVKDEVLTCVNLDIIPGEWGRRATAVEVEEACEASFAQWQLLRSSGAMIMPVYHQTDNLKWLHKYLEAGAEFIGISPTDSFSPQVRQAWLVDIHEYMRGAGVRLNEDVFTHALGVFSPATLSHKGMGLWSADASTIMRYVAWKRILLPKTDTTGQIIGWDPVYVGKRDKHVTNVNVEWDYVKEYLKEIGHGDSYDTCPRTGRCLIDDFGTTISISLHLAKRAMHQSGVRCFIAGQMPLAIWQICIAERYPYILRSYAVIKEIHGETIKKLYRRDAPKPPRRPERDHKVEPSRGLFTF